MKRFVLPFFAILIAVAIWYPGAFRQLPDRKRSSGIKVVASIFPLADIVRQVAGDRAEVVLLLPAGASPHTFEPTPGQVSELGKASLFVQVGAGLELWADKLINAVGNSGLKRVTAAQGIALITGEEEHSGSDEHEEETEHGHDHGKFGNPHIWLDPAIVLGIVTKIEEALIEADPAGEDYYRNRAERYRREVELLDKEIERKTAKFVIREFGPPLQSKAGRGYRGNAGTRTYSARNKRDHICCAQQRHKGRLCRAAVFRLSCPGYRRECWSKGSLFGSSGGRRHSRLRQLYQSHEA